MPACHTRLRELEVLKNTLLRCLADDPTGQHRDIVVMAPDIGAYAPYLAAVFGEPAQYRNDPLHIPWHLADVGLVHAHPLMSAFTQMLDLAESRFTVSEVLDFRSEGRRVGKACVSTCRSRWSTNHKKNKNTKLKTHH